MTFDDFALNVHFTVSAWIRPDSFTANQTIFSKIDSSYAVVFKAYIDISGNIAVELARPDRTSTEVKTTSLSAITTSWQFVVYGISLQSTATSAEVNFKVDGDTADDTITFSTGYYYLDDSTPYKAHVGAIQSGSSSFSEPFAGFMYALYIDNTYLSGAASSWYPS